MASKIALSNAILCEHFVPGLGNKNSLINIYSGDVLVQEMPAKLLLALYMEYTSEAPETYTVQVDVVINKKPYARLKFAVEGGRQQGVMAIPNMELAFDRDVILEIKATADGERARTVLRKRVALGVVPPIAPSASPPPSARSPRAARAKA